jgi:hypothetical protein
MLPSSELGEIEMSALPEFIIKARTAAGLKLVFEIDGREDRFTVYRSSQEKMAEALKAGLNRGWKLCTS